MMVVSFGVQFTVIVMWLFGSAIATKVGVVVFAISWLQLPVALYWLRRRYRLAYGVLELFVGIATVFGSSWPLMTSGLPPDAKVSGFLAEYDLHTLAMGAAVYVCVRALDNVGEGLKGYPRGKKIWDEFFPEPLPAERLIVPTNMTDRPSFTQR
jgi:hypothetical protein